MGLGQRDAAQKVARLVGPRRAVAGTAPRCRETSGHDSPRPAEGVFCLPYCCCLGGATLVVGSATHPVRVHRHYLADDETDFGEQLARMPSILGDHPAWLIPSFAPDIDVRRCA